MSESLRKAHELILAGDIDGANAVLGAVNPETEDPFSALCVRAHWFMRQRRWPEAIEILNTAAQINPIDFTIHYNRGLVLYELGQFAQAAAAYRQSIKIHLGYAKAFMKLAACHMVMQEFAEAMACYERAVNMDPTDAELYIGFGTFMSTIQQDEAAIMLFRKALELNPEAFEADVSLGFVLLRAGQWEEGWQRFEARWKMHAFGTTWDYKGQALWTGKPKDLDGKIVLLRSEQGYGDTIQFSRYIPLVAKRAGKVYVETHASMVDLLSGLGATVIVRDGDAAGLPNFDLQTSLMSLPLIFGTRTDYCPQPTMFKVPKRENLPAKVGVCWHGGARPQEPISNADDQRRSIPPAIFEPLTQVVPVISLQQEDLKEWGCETWAQTAELIKGLKLVITVDTAIAHLAASLDVETWCLLRMGGCWRWLSNGDRTCWYATMKLYRQPVLAEWGPVVQRVLIDLQAWAQKHG